MLKTYRELEVWKSAIELVAAVYVLTRCWPESERFALASQIQRASVSVPANIAEGYGRARRGEYLHHLSIARGSLAEVETLLVIAVKVGYVDRESATPLWERCQTTGKLLNGHVRALKAKSAPSRSTASRAEPRTPKPEPRA